MSKEFLLANVIGLFLYVGISFYALRIENDYQKLFSLPHKTFKDLLPALGIGLLAAFVYSYVSQERITAIAIPFMWSASASLRSIYTVDRKLLVIPDRLQMIGLLSSIGFVSALIYSGEDPRATFIEIGFGMAMVALMWILSIVYERLRGTIGFGFGDTKLLAWLALFVGKRMPNLVMLSVLIGLVFLAVHTIGAGLKAKKWALPKGQDAFAFGPAIVWAVLIDGVFYYV